METIYGELRDIGRIFGVSSRAEALIATYQADIKAIQARIGVVSKPPTVFWYDDGDPPSDQAVEEGTFADVGPAHDDDGRQLSAHKDDLGGDHRVPRRARDGRSWICGVRRWVLQMGGFRAIHHRGHRRHRGTRGSDSAIFVLLG